MWGDLQIYKLNSTLPFLRITLQQFSHGSLTESSVPDSQMRVADGSLFLVDSESCTVNWSSPHLKTFIPLPPLVFFNLITVCLVYAGIHRLTWRPNLLSMSCLQTWIFIFIFVFVLWPSRQQSDIIILNLLWRSLRLLQIVQTMGRLRWTSFFHYPTSTHSVSERTMSTMDGLPEGLLSTTKTLPSSFDDSMPVHVQYVTLLWKGTSSCAFRSRLWPKVTDLYDQPTVSSPQRLKASLDTDWRTSFGGSGAMNAFASLFLARLWPSCLCASLSLPLQKWARYVIIFE